MRATNITKVVAFFLSLFVIASAQGYQDDMALASKANTEHYSVTKTVTMQTTLMNLQRRLYSGSRKFVRGRTTSANEPSEQRTRDLNDVMTVTVAAAVATAGTAIGGIVSGIAGYLIGRHRTTPTPSPTPAPTPTLTVDDFNVDIDFINVADNIQQVFITARTRWSQVITDGLPQASAAAWPNPCRNGVSGPAVVDDLLICARGITITQDGILGQAGPELVRLPSFLPITGKMEFDFAKIQPTLQETIVSSCNSVPTA
jgi:hypothetical protein